MDYYIFYWKMPLFQKHYPTDTNELFTKFQNKVETLSKNDIVWVVSKYKPLDMFVLAGELHVTDTKPKNHPTDPDLGSFCIVSDKSKNRWYNLIKDEQKGFESILIELFGCAGKDIKCYFQGQYHIRKLKDPKMIDKISDFARNLTQI